MTSVLSPQAAPFYPLSFEPINLAVYNNGIPSLIFYHGSESEILHGISDEGMDEAFPPSAQDAAELEATEIFVSLMANLAMMEEREEAARETHTGFVLRWEVRRKQVAHPLPPKHIVHRVSHGDHHLLDSSSLVPFDHSDRIQEHRMRARDSARNAKPKTSKIIVKPAFRKPIQQPRKTS